MPVEINVGKCLLLIQTIFRPDKIVALGEWGKENRSEGLWYAWEKLLTVALEPLLAVGGWRLAVLEENSNMLRLEIIDP